MSEALTLSINEAVVEKIRQHGAETYPNECCGALLGRDADAEAIPARATREVLATFPLVNRRDDSPRNRFFVTAEDAHDADKAAQAQGLGFDWLVPFASRSSGKAQRVRSRARLAVVQLHHRECAERKPADMTSWRLQDDRSAFDSEELRNTRSSQGLRKPRRRRQTWPCE